MKTPLLSSLAFGLLLSCPVHGQSKQAKEGNPFNDIDAQIRVQVEYIEVSQDQFTELMFGDKPAKNDLELRKQLGKMIKDGKAKVVENLLCTTTTGQKATTESIEEYIYPTEYDPADFFPIPKPDADDTKTTAPIDVEAAGPNPTAFETRNLGPTLEILPSLSEKDGEIRLRIVSEIVVHVGDVIWGEWKDKRGENPIKMPTFYTLRFNCAVRLMNGKPMLANALTPMNDKGKSDFSRKVLTFVRATVIEP